MRTSARILMKFDTGNLYRPAESYRVDFIFILIVECNPSAKQAQTNVTNVLKNDSSIQILYGMLCNILPKDGASYMNARATLPKGRTKKWRQKGVHRFFWDPLRCSYA
jgi:hypothetical protein